jgi:hypothetical protein
MDNCADVPECFGLREFFGRELVWLSGSVDVDVRLRVIRSRSLLSVSGTSKP